MIIKTLHKITSLNNLRSPCFEGQVATILILLMVVVLMFILVTANIGNIANLSTMLSNAADTATLQLASKLATKSRQISEALEEACGDEEECCAKTGLLGIILAIIVAIIVTILTWGTGWAVIGPMLAAAAAGAIGNAIVYGTWEGAAYGALQGAVIGLTIATAAQAGAAIGESSVATPAGAMCGETSALMELEALFIAKLALAETIGAAVGMSSMAGSALYIGDPIQKRNVNSLKKFGEGLNGLPEYDRIREQAILTSLSMTVTDPNTTIAGPCTPENTITCGTINPIVVCGGDPNDIDGDGDREESTTCFENWYYDRITSIKGLIIAQYKNAIDLFVNSQLIPYRDYIEGLYTNAGPLSRQEIEGADGILIETLRALEPRYSPPAAYDFWTPGPNALRLADWQTCSNSATACPQTRCASICPQCQWQCPSACGSCILPGYDEIDWNISSFKDFVAKADSIIASSSNARALTWQDWIGFFIGVKSLCPVCRFDNPREYTTCAACGATLTPKGYYKRLMGMVYGDADELGIKGYYTWSDYFYDYDGPSGPDWGVTALLPNCTYVDATEQEATNPPCINSNTGRATIDADPDDEIWAAYYEVEYLRLMSGDPYGFIVALQGFYYYMMDMLGRSVQSQALNPVEYGWEDGQGQHTIKVTVGPFKIPETDEDSRGNFLVGEECIVLDHGEDKSGDRTWVKIRRSDPTKELKSGKRALGWWNPPFHSNLGNTITRISRASFTRDAVSVCGRDINNNCDHDNDY